MYNTQMYASLDQTNCPVIVSCHYEQLVLINCVFMPLIESLFIFIAVSLLYCCARAPCCYTLLSHSYSYCYMWCVCVCVCVVDSVCML